MTSNFGMFVVACFSSLHIPSPKTSIPAGPETCAHSPGLMGLTDTSKLYRIDPNCSKTCPMILSLPVQGSRGPESNHSIIAFTPAVPHLDIFEAFIARPAKSSGQQYQVHAGRLP